MKKRLRVSFKYLNRFDKEVEIIKTENNSFFGDDGIEYNGSGVALRKGSSWDLVEYAKGFPQLILTLPIPVEHIGLNSQTQSNYHDYRHEDHEVVVRYIEKIPKGPRPYAQSKQFYYRAHYELPSQYSFNLYYPSWIESGLKMVSIDRKSTGFNPSDFHFTDDFVEKHDSRVAKVDTAEFIKSSKY